MHGFLALGSGVLARPAIAPYGERVARTRERDACPGCAAVAPRGGRRPGASAVAQGSRLAGQLAALAHAADPIRIARHGTHVARQHPAAGHYRHRGRRRHGRRGRAAALADPRTGAQHRRVAVVRRVGGSADVRGLVTELDEAIRSEPALAELPGRFMFGVDDGRADTSGLAADVGAHFLDEATAALLLAGRDTGVRLSRPDAVPALVTLASRFAAIRGKAWRVAELADVPSKKRVLLEHFTAGAAPAAPWPAAIRPPVGWLTQDDGRVTLGAAAPLACCRPGPPNYLAAIGAPMVITPWRSVLICDLDDGVAEAVVRVLAPTGLVFDEHSPWLCVSFVYRAAPGCAHSAADVRADAAAALDVPTAGPSALRRLRTGVRQPDDGEVLVATADGYRLRGCARRVSGCSTTSATRPRSIGSRSRRSAPRRTCRGSPTTSPGVVVRLIHTCGQVDVAEHVAFSEDVVAKTHAALVAGAPVLCDSSMVAAGITRSRLPAGNEVVALVADTGAEGLPEATGTTRSAAAVDLWADRLGGAVLAIGNAPTALFRLMELVDDGGAATPAAVLGGPVGFVGSAQSKQELIDRPRGMAYLVVRGRRGGSAMAAAAVNAIAGIGNEQGHALGCRARAR